MCTMKVCGFSEENRYAFFLYVFAGNSRRFLIMACFIAPAAEAVITTIAAKAVKSQEKRENESISLSEKTTAETVKIPFSVKLGWLNKMLWGGSALLAFEHVWHGEVVPFFPFLTAVKTGETAEMLAEIGSTGVLMSAIVTAVWLGMVAVSTVIEKKALSVPETAKEGI